MNTKGVAAFSAGSYMYITLYMYTGCPGGNVPHFGRMFLTLKYTDITQNTYISEVELFGAVTVGGTESVFSHRCMCCTITELGDRSAYFASSSHM